MVTKDISEILQRLYSDRCDVIEFIPTTDEFGITQYNEKIVLEKIPCLVCYKNQKAAIKGKSSDYLTQSVSLLLDKEANVKAGSIIRVYKANGSEFVEYQKTGEPSFYANHQEIQMVLRKTNV